MSFRVVANVLDFSEERLARRLILVVLAETAHDDGVVFLGQDEISRKARLSRTHVIEEIKGLVSDGALQVRKAHRKRKRINVYRLNLPGLKDVDYERLPFEVREPFDDVGTSDTVENDDVGSTGSTTSDLPGSSPHVVEPPVEPSKTLVPQVEQIEGRNLPFDALAEVCSINVQNRARVSEMTRALKDIRHYVAEEYPGAAGGDEFERLAAAEVVRRAGLYRTRMPGATLTPTALAKWWHDCASETPAARATARRFGRGVTTRELLDAADQLEQEPEERRELASG